MFDKSLFIIQNKTLYGILTEIKLFENFKINFDKDLESFLNRDIDLIDRKSLCILNYELDSDFDAKIKKIVIPVILLTYDKKISLRSNFYEIKIPFQINYFFQRINKIFSQAEYQERSFIQIMNLNLDLNDRSISDGKSKLKLTEKEIEFITYLKNSKEPVKINNLLENVWKYSKDIETHTIETHVHRLRKKFQEKFNLNDVIKNNKDGYFI
tara:strand:+ start:189 stop:824 length:636 start_codon:yes stop_codon:yes gene_type:complete